MCVPCSRCCVHALHTLYTSTVWGTFCYSPPSPPGKLSLSKVTYPRWARITRGQLTPGTWALNHNSWGTAVVLKSTPHCCQRVLSKLSSGLPVFLHSAFPSSIKFRYSKFQFKQETFTSPLRGSPSSSLLKSLPLGVFCCHTNWGSYPLELWLCLVWLTHKTARLSRMLLESLICLFCSLPNTKALREESMQIKGSIKCHYRLPKNWCHTAQVDFSVQGWAQRGLCHLAATSWWQYHHQHLQLWLIFTLYL